MAYSKWINKKVLSAALLVTAPTVKASGGKVSNGSGVSEGGKSQRGVNHLTLEEAPGFLKKEERETLLDKLNKKIEICVPNGSTSKTGDYHFLSDNIVVVMPPFETNVVRMTFLVSHIVADEKDRILFLAYSQKRTPSPPIPSPRSLNKLELDFDTLELVGIYNIPALRLEPQASTRIGAADPAPRAKIEFDINLSPQEISTMMNSGNDTIYVQAALVPKSDFVQQKWDGMVLSELDTIRFVPNECPEGYVIYGDETVELP